MKDPKAKEAAYRAQARYSQTERGKETKRRYMESELGKQRRREEYASGRHAEYNRRWERRKKEQEKREQEELTAYLPVEVVQPFAQKLLEAFQLPPGAPFRSSDPYEGIHYLASNAHMSEKTLRGILDGTTKQVDYASVDRLATYAGWFSLEEIYDRAREWALLTGSEWPRGYLRSESAQSRNRRMANQKLPLPTPESVYAPTRKTMLIFKEHQPLTRHELAELQGTTYRVATDRVAWLRRRGLLEMVPEAMQKTATGKRRDRFALTEDGQRLADTFAAEFAAR